MRSVPVGLALSLIVASSQARAGDGVSLANINWSPVRDCLSGKLSENDALEPLRETKARGHLFVLDQRKSSLSCSLPRKDVISWVTPVSDSAAEVTFLYENSEGTLTAKRYSVQTDSLNSKAQFELPDSAASCLPVGPKIVSAVIPKSPVTVRIDSWGLTSVPKEGLRSEQKRRYSVSSVEPSSEAPKLKLTEVSLPTNNVLLTEVLREFAPTVESIQDKFSDLGDGLKKHVGYCEEAVKEMTENRKIGSVSLLQAAQQAIRSTDQISSIFVKPKPGHMTIKEFNQKVSSPGSYIKKVSTGVD